jgi:hypothetical protein
VKVGAETAVPGVTTEATHGRLRIAPPKASPGRKRFPALNSSASFAARKEPRNDPRRASGQGDTLNFLGRNALKKAEIERFSKKMKKTLARILL